MRSGMSCQRQQWYRLFPVTLVMATIFFLSHQPGTAFSLPDIVNIDKALHCLAYTVLGLSVFFAVPLFWQEQHSWRAGLCVVLFCLLYGISDEFHQSFIPGRCSTVTDLAADVLGGGIAVLIHEGLRRKGRRLVPG